ncbi:hypothetical protein [Streptomyces sp. NPDC057729]|uniref:hypothetical protein n=1 Tax=Streptomyces sp. NPDC057729 TaxID=3346230 RepID=UPI003699A776
MPPAPSPDHPRPHHLHRLVEELRALPVDSDRRREIVANPDGDVEAARTLTEWGRKPDAR